jgi:hypothetical protein
MKKTIITSIAAIYIQILFSQISMTNVAPEISKEIIPFDSLQNFLGIDYLKYKGQELYLIPKAESLRKYGYEGFILDINKSESDESNKFKCCDSYNSKYQELEGKYFIVEDVLIDPKSNNSPYAYLKLKTKDSKESVFFKYSSKYKHSFPFLVVGYYEKQKSIFLNNEVLVRNFPKIQGANQKKIIDIATGIEIDIAPGVYLKCLDVTIDQKYFEPALLLQNETGQKFLFSLNARYLNIQRIFTKAEAEKYRLKFGDENWMAILEEKVIVGFTEEMAKASWGQPDKINKASYGDQWVYGTKYLYFENGLLKSFN